MLWESLIIIFIRAKCLKSSDISLFHISLLYSSLKTKMSNEIFPANIALTKRYHNIWGWFLPHWLLKVVGGWVVGGQKYYSVSPGPSPFLLSLWNLDLRLWTWIGDLDGGRKSSLNVKKYHTFFKGFPFPFTKSFPILCK